MVRDAFDDMADEFEEIATRHIKAVSVQFYKWVRRDTRTHSRPFGSAVRTGRYSASIRFSVNNIDRTAEPDANHEGGDLAPDQRLIPLPSVREATSALSKFKLGDVIYVTITLDYADELEEGSSRKAPGGIFGPTMLFWERSLRASLKGDTAPLYGTIYSDSL